ncbi:streptothricin acetyltransferase [Myxococcus fulvus]|uniref:N-acetyltransferase n=1 Tax=Myxococcus fulvus TaxID=33 RepID=A0A511T0J3_MYXFU|nr:GNAT family N-acetyltransferase [Myxococcus fulvus]GEN07681.1 N-acetyltransferase [Myxococcus fulvus]SES83097.1 streptothricin acetyltransferase [Myxococcus fulvus]
MRIEHVEKLTAAELSGSDFSFDVEEEAVAPFDGPTLSRTVPVTRYTKRYELEADLVETTDPAQSLIVVARSDGQVAGYILVSRAWNHCAQVDDFAVARSHRRQGLARALMDEAVRWTRERGLQTIRLETQSNNVPACRFYERYGFRLGGFDRYLYSAIPSQPRPEVALFWYLRVSPSPPSGS